MGLVSNGAPLQRGPALASCSTYYIADFTTNSFEVAGKLFALLCTARGTYLLTVSRSQQHEYTGCTADNGLEHQAHPTVINCCKTISTVISNGAVCSSPASYGSCPFHLPTTYRHDNIFADTVCGSQSWAVTMGLQCTTTC